MQAETEFMIKGGVGRIRLNRPQVLNALSPTQFGQIAGRLRGWAEDPAVALVTIEGAGERAFCAGGDIRAVYDGWKEGQHEANRAIFRDEYRLDRLIHHYPKPYVALLDGIVMGGGAGVSVNGRFRVATERTLFAMPETAIGFFPDVGATHFLNRCPGRIGLYLGLTGTRIGPADALWAGLATHYVPSADLPALHQALAEGEDVAAVLARFHRDPGHSALAERAEAVDRCFGGDGLVSIVAALVAEDAPWAGDALAAITRSSPFAVVVAFRQLAEGRDLSFDEAIRREFRLACRFLAGHDLYEGIRALVVDKDRTPAWRPGTLGEVDDGAVAACFAPLGTEELPLP